MNGNTEAVVEIEFSQFSESGPKTRCGLKESAVQYLLDLLKDGVKLDPAIAIQDGPRLYLAAGDHRREAYRRFEKTAMPCVVRPGDRWTAIVEGLKDNLGHGEKLSREDKDHNVRLVLKEKTQF